MQLTTLAAGLLALAASASATPVMGTIKMFFDRDSDCTGTPIPINGDGSSVAIPPDYVGQCHGIPAGFGNKTYKRFSASGLTPIFSFELYTDSECQNLATNASNVCVSDVKSYIGRRRDGN
ncbi:hypothetical protein CH063_13941 [Colletotrichum higginsianum]|uniref:Uncharacterized protein n=2 Tax=Colletotrichum higginsianum TaxID=80884 RepID=H1VWH7_COLHI|nr:hypothetical protein CH63R_08493 [Colletotrichum higginsianum IMI 349063]OBR06972.1 hypothetical protein CH63R_08493 [Colletotrichum higginsianum IMI 349063]TIC92266.1 hypothetical protein CH35J_009991 [Colletotrichum higginsianum]CCF44589.1 hypothetical protein CH063_13941 [Colletotrichum higginsianum]